MKVSTNALRPAGRLAIHSGGGPGGGGGRTTSGFTPSRMKAGMNCSGGRASSWSYCFHRSACAGLQPGGGAIRVQLQVLGNGLDVRAQCLQKRTVSGLGREYAPGKKDDPNRFHGRMLGRAGQPHYHLRKRPCVDTWKCRLRTGEVAGSVQRTATKGAKMPKRFFKMQVMLDTPRAIRLSWCQVVLAKRFFTPSIVSPFPFERK